MSETEQRVTLYAEPGKSVGDFVLVSWMKRCGYRAVRLVDVTTTTVEEQRSTAWMRFESLADFLDPDNAALTIEGHPAPQRAIVTARR